MHSTPKARIRGMGSYLPERVLSNDDLSKMVDTNDEWITTRTGIKERRIAAVDESSADMGVIAAERALKSASVSPAEIDLVLVATTTADHVMPSAASVIQARLGIPEAAAMDIQAACTGHMYGLSVAQAYVRAGIFRRILLVSVDKMSSIVNYEDRSTCILFGDGACAVVVTDEGPGFVLQHVCLGSDGERANLLYIPGGGSREPLSVETLQQGRQYVLMEGREVYKHAVRRMVSAAENCLSATGLTLNDIRWVIPHQANLRIIEAVGKRLDIPEDRVYGEVVKRYGNQSAASVGIALDELIKEQGLNVGETVMMLAFGAGFTWGAAVATKVSE